MVYQSFSSYINCASSTRAKIARIDEIISALLDSAADAATNEGVSQYTLNDGQVIVNASNRSSKSIMESIKSFESLKSYYQQQLTGRVMRLVDSKNFSRKRSGR
jgi:hypothetical protein